MKNKEIIRITENLTLLNILAPIGGIEYYKNYFRVGDYLGRVYAITKYPQKVISNSKIIFKYELCS